jgi:hypothetical protein
MTSLLQANWLVLLRLPSLREGEGRSKALKRPATRRAASQPHVIASVRNQCCKVQRRAASIAAKDVQQAVQQTFYGVKEIASQSRRESFSIRFLFLVPSEL